MNDVSLAFILIWDDKIIFTILIILSNNIIKTLIFYEPIWFNFFYA